MEPSKRGQHLRFHFCHDLLTRFQENYWICNNDTWREKKSFNLGSNEDWVKLVADLETTKINEDDEEEVKVEAPPKRLLKVDTECF